MTRLECLEEDLHVVEMENNARVRICEGLTGQDDFIGFKWLLRNALSDLSMRVLVLKKWMVL